MTYVNTGDFVESCSLVVEHYDGQFEIMHWSTPFAQRQRERAAAPRDATARPSAEAEAEAA